MNQELADIIRQHEVALLEPQTRASAAELDRLIADDFIEFGSSGNIYDKAAILRDLPHERANISYEMSDFALKVLAEHIVIATYKLKKSSAGEKIMTASLRSSIWRNESGQWRMVFHQSTVNTLT